MNAPNPPLKAAIVPVTAFQQNCTLLWCTETNKAALVDPGGDLPKLREAIRQTGVEVEKILVTHGHM
ncbi:MAG: MBL fold metallo-hydrolase, partial [Sphingopyxis terrae]